PCLQQHLLRPTFKAPTSLATSSKSDINFAPSAVIPSFKSALSASTTSLIMDVTPVKPAMSIASATSITPVTATTIPATAMTSLSDSKPSNQIVMPSGRPIARMRTKTPSITPVIVMPPGRAIAKPRRLRS
ncbi:hypothetical protein BGZ47_003905, partial [Haplosporangium gracile]